MKGVVERDVVHSAEMPFVTFSFRNKEDGSLNVR